MTAVVGRPSGATPPASGTTGPSSTEPVAKSGWSTTSVMVHWTAAVLIVGLGAMGFVMTDLAGDSRLRLLFSRLHTGLGVTLMALTIFRLVVRWRGQSPAPLPLPAIHRRGVSVVHGLLYLVQFSLGASGALTGLLSAWPQYLRGEVAAAPELAYLGSRQVHEALVFVLLTLIGLHVGGVVLQELRHGGTLRRMVPALRRRPHAEQEVR